MRRSVTNRMAHWMLAACAATLPAAGAVAEQAGMLYASDPEAIAALIRDEGYKAQVGVDGVGDPKITSAIDGSNYTILFYGCTEGANCDSVQFRAGWRMDGGVTLEVLDDWNTTKRFGKAYRDDEDDPNLEMNLTMVGGVTRENFLETLDWWGIAVRGFKAHLNEN